MKQKGHRASRWGLAWVGVCLALAGGAVLGVDGDEGDSVWQPGGLTEPGEARLDPRTGLPVGVGARRVVTTAGAPSRAHRVAAGEQPQVASGSSPSTSTLKADAANAIESVTGEARPHPDQLLDPVQLQGRLEGMIANVFRRGRGDPAEGVIATAELLKLLQEAQGQLGLESLHETLRHPVVQEAFLPAWLNALGAELDAQQVEQVRALAREGAEIETPSGSYGVRLAASLRQKAKLEGSLREVLRPEQYDAYQEQVRGDLFFGAPRPNRSIVGGDSPQELAGHVAANWKRVFGLETEQEVALSRVATRYVDRTLRAQRREAGAPPTLPAKSD